MPLVAGRLVGPGPDPDEKNAIEERAGGLAVAGSAIGGACVGGAKQIKFGYDSVSACTIGLTADELYTACASQGPVDTEPDSTLFSYFQPQPLAGHNVSDTHIGIFGDASFKLLNDWVSQSRQACVAQPSPSMFAADANDRTLTSVRVWSGRDQEVRGGVGGQLDRHHADLPGAHHGVQDRRVHRAGRQCAGAAVESHRGLPVLRHLRRALPATHWHQPVRCGRSDARIARWRGVLHVVRAMCEGRELCADPGGRAAAQDGG